MKLIMMKWSSLHRQSLYIFHLERQYPSLTRTICYDCEWCFGQNRIIQMRRRTSVHLNICLWYVTQFNFTYYQLFFSAKSFAHFTLYNNNLKVQSNMESILILIYYIHIFFYLIILYFTRTNNRKFKLNKFTFLKYEMLVFNYTFLVLTNTIKMLQFNSTNYNLRSESTLYYSTILLITKYLLAVGMSYNKYV